MINPRCCPICGYEFAECQCDRPGAYHAKRANRYRVVLDHLYLLTPEQLKWVVKLESKWKMKYNDERLNTVLDEMRARD